jgi:phage head maturation protease
MDSQPTEIRATAKTQPNSLAFTATVSLDLEAKGSDGAPRRPTFAITAYTGAPMQVAGFFTPVIVDLAGLKAERDKIPILLDHDSTRIVGQTDGITVDSSGVRLTGIVTGEDGDAAKVVSHARNGFEWQASIGAQIIRQEFLKAGEKAVVNGREVAGPLLIARESRLRETSFVAIGADPQTTASVAASSDSLGTSHEREPTMFELWLKAKGFEDPAALTDQQKTSLQAAFNAEQAAEKIAAKAGDPVTFTAASQARTLDQIFADQEKENSRVAKITELTASAISDYPGRLDEFKALSTAAIEAKTSVVDFELNLLRLSRRFPHFKVTNVDRLAPKAIEAALCRAGGLRDIERHYDEKTLEASERQYRNGIGLRDLLLMAARENGYTGTSSKDIKPILRSAFADGGDIRASGFSTLSLSGILGNTANKFLAQGFNAVEAGWRDISTIRNVTDFKTVTSYSLTGGMTYDKVGPSGELKHATVGETSYTNAADTYGKMFAITRRDIINDDLGALTQVPFRLGRGAAIKLNDVFWTAFMASITVFWAAGNNNVSSGAGSALSSAGLTAALLKFRKQVDPDSLPLGIMPKILLVPPELEITADELMTSTAVNTGGSSTTAQVPNRNVWTSKFKVVTSTYLSNSSYTGYSTAHWFLLADPMELPTIEVAFLNGRDTPTVESADADIDTLGIQMRGYHDFGVSRQEYRASVRSIGS